MSMLRFCALSALLWSLSFLAFAHDAPVPPPDPADAVSIAAKGTCEDCGAILGTIREAGTDLPLADIQVLFWSPMTGHAPLYTASGPDGTFDSGQALPEGIWYVYTSTASHINQVYPDVSCLYHCNPWLGAGVAVEPGAVVPLQFALSPGAELHGTVTDTVDAPVQGAVFVNNENGDTFSIGVLPDGTYSSGNVLPPGNYRLRTSTWSGLIDEAYPDIPCIGGGCAWDIGASVVLPPTGQTQVNFELAPGMRLTGSVTAAASGLPVEGSAVALFGPGATHGFFIPVAPDGTYNTFTGLPPGEWRLAAMPAAGLLGQLWGGTPCGPCDPLQSAPLQIVGAGVTPDIDFSLASGAFVSGQITDADTGAAIAGATIVIFRASDAAVLTSTGSDANGDYQSQSFMPEPVTVMVMAPGYVTQMYGTDEPCGQTCNPANGAVIDATGGETTGIDVALRASLRLEGRVLSHDGTALAHVDLNLSAADTNTYGGSATTDETGRFVFEDLLPGRYHLFAYGYGAFVDTAWPSTECMIYCVLGEENVITLAYGEPQDDIELRIVQGGTVTGRIADEQTDAPIPGARVSAYTFEDYLAGGSDGADGDGRYTTVELPPGQYYLNTSDTGAYIAEAHLDVPCSAGCDNALLEPVTVVAGQATTVDFALARGGRIAGRLTGPGGAPTGLSENLSVLDGNTVFVIGATTDSNGNYITDGLPDGTYYVRTRNRSGLIDELFDGIDCAWCSISQSGATPVTISAGQTAGDIDFELDTGHRIGGRVLDAEGAILPQSVVSVYAADGRRIGNYGNHPLTGVWRTTAGLPPGTYYASVLPRPQYGPALYDNAPCSPEECNILGGTPIVVAGPGETTTIDIVVPHGVLFGDDFE